MENARKRKIADILGCYKLLNQPPPDVMELVSKNTAELDKIYEECLKKSIGDLGLPRF